MLARWQVLSTVVGGVGDVGPVGGRREVKRASLGVFQSLRSCTLS